ncbi:MAG: LysE family transporter [Desulfuromonadaceae bacterium]|nr:LysE family transporter [Desulfuromonadaceae bacterium]MDD5106634.1 LysE family transporter [Desulfuromonadaceae bacterium]
MIDFLIIGILLGLSAGFAPGPLLTLVISETLQHGIRSGAKVALAPVVTDIPIILLAIFIVSKLSGFQYALGIISLTGGVFILIAGYQSICTKAVKVSIEHKQPKSLMKGIVANFLNPHPYLFWISVGGPTMSKALTKGVVPLCAFIAGFYLALVGAKVMLAVAVGRSRTFLSDNIYLYTLRFFGLLLCLFAVILFCDGAKLLGLL